MDTPKYDLMTSAACVGHSARDAIEAAKAGDRQAFRREMLRALDNVSFALRQEHNGAPLNKDEVPNG